MEISCNITSILEDDYDVASMVNLKFVAIWKLDEDTAVQYVLVCMARNYSVYFSVI
jgi:hypothetical protein